MIAVDTNVIVRFLVRDDARQAEAVRIRLKEAERTRERIFVPLLVVLETIWVLESAYGKTRSEMLAALEDLRRMPIFDFEADAVVERVLADGASSRADLSDLLIAHAARASGCERVLTFDRDAAKFPIFQLLS